MFTRDFIIYEITSEQRADPTWFKDKNALNSGVFCSLLLSQCSLLGYKKENLFPFTKSLPIPEDECGKQQPE